MKRNPREEGSALVLALIAAFLLLIVSFEVAHTTRIETFITKNVEADARLEVACRSGLERALALLREDRQQTEIDSQGDSWYKLFVDSELVESEFGKDEFLFDEATQEEASFDVKLFIEIQDESSKFNVYGLRSDDAAERRKRREKFAQLVDRFRDAWGEWDLSVVDGELIAEHLLEFIDRTEDRPYRNVPVPSTKGLGGINDIGELLYLEPITPEILWDQRTEDGEAMIPGLYRFLTVWSDMQININTAPHATLSTLFEPQFVYLAERIVDFRERADEERERDLSRFERRPDGENGQTSGEDATDPTGGAPFTQIGELRDKVEGIGQEVYNAMQSLITVQSSVFSVFVTAEWGRLRRTKMWVVRRSEQGFQVLLERPVEFPHYIATDQLEEADQNLQDRYSR